MQNSSGLKFDMIYLRNILFLLIVSEQMKKPLIVFVVVGLMLAGIADAAVTLTFDELLRRRRTL